MEIIRAFESNLQNLTSLTSLISLCLYFEARRNRGVFGDNDDAIADEVARAVVVSDGVTIDEPCAFSDAGILVYDDSLEHDLAADSDRH